MQILFLGPQGAGKGTQCKRLAENANLPHLSSGDLLRESLTAATKAGIEIKKFIDAGQLVPDPTLIAMFEEKLAQSGCANGFILDGFPRNLAQAASLDSLLARLDKPMSAVINLEIDDALAMERMMGRRLCSNKDCGAIYNLKFAPPTADNICDVCSSPLIQRSDDRQDACEKRLSSYHEQTEPLIDYYGAKGLLKVISADGNPETIFRMILDALKLANHVTR